MADNGSFFATHHPNGADAHGLLKILLITDGRLLVINKEMKEPNVSPKRILLRLPTSWAVPLTEHDWNPNGRGLAFLQHYRKCILQGFKKGLPKQKNLNMIQAPQQNPNEDPSEFLKIYQAYWKHMDADPQAPENVLMVNKTFIGQSASDIQSFGNESLSVGRHSM